MQRHCPRALLAALFLAPPLFAADVFTEGTITFSLGGAFQEGDRPSFQQLTQQRKDGYGGIEDYRMTRESGDDIWRFDARLLPGNDDYLLRARFERLEKFKADAGFEFFRVWSDGSAGFFRPTGTSFVLFDEDLSLTRSKLWLELGAFTPNQTLFTFRYEQHARKGTKSSTYWGDSNLIGAPYGTRNIVPAFYDLDEVTHILTVDAGNDTKEDVKWHVGARYAETDHDNQRSSRRRPFEAADRIVTTRDGTQSDLFAGHGFYQRRVGEKLTLSGGALITDLDTILAGSRIYGGTYDPVYDPAFVRRQQRDEGFFDLAGHANLKQTVLNLNAVYVPREHWSVRPSFRFENLRQRTVSDSMETNVGGGAARPATIEEVEGRHRKTWDEFSESLLVQYTGRRDWTFSVTGDWVQGSGDLEEERILHTGVKTIDRHSDNTRTSQKYAFKTNWYAKPGLTFAAQYYHKVNRNDYDAIRDNTLPGTANRYPAYITDQDFETDDFNIRVSWRPAPLLSTVTRYDYQRSRITSNEAGLTAVQSSRLTSHILSESVTWTPVNRLFLSASVNITWDQLATPAYLFVVNSDSNYVNGSLGAGYALAKRDDVYLDYAFYEARNFVDNSAVNLPYAADQERHAGYLTWVRRHSENLVVTTKYGYVTHRDDTWSGLNDFNAHVLYAKVQYRF